MLHKAESFCKDHIISCYLVKILVVVPGNILRQASSLPLAPSLNDSLGLWFLGVKPGVSTMTPQVSFIESV